MERTYVTKVYFTRDFLYKTITNKNLLLKVSFEFRMILSIFLRLISNKFCLPNIVSIDDRVLSLMIYK